MYKIVECAVMSQLCSCCYVSTAPLRYNDNWATHIKSMHASVPSSYYPLCHKYTKQSN